MKKPPMEDQPLLHLPDSHDLTLTFTIDRVLVQNQGIMPGKTALVTHNGLTASCMIIDIHDNHPSIPSGQVEIVAKHLVSYITSGARPL